MFHPNLYSKFLVSLTVYGYIILLLQKQVAKSNGFSYNLSYSKFWTFLVRQTGHHINQIDSNVYCSWLFSLFLTLILKISTAFDVPTTISCHSFQTYTTWIFVELVQCGHRGTIQVSLCLIVFSCCFVL